MILYEKKICVITSSRAEYGLLRNLIKKISIQPSFTLQLVVSGTHLSKEYGFTKKKIIEDKINIIKEVRIVQKKIDHKTYANLLLWQP